MAVNVDVQGKIQGANQSLQALNTIIVPFSTSVLALHLKRFKKYPHEFAYSFS